jgi:hypothetical protein
MLVLVWVPKVEPARGRGVAPSGGGWRRPQLGVALGINNKEGSGCGTEVEGRGSPVR